MMHKGIIWLASYPKSGNTWFRIVLANLLNPSNQPISVNQLNVGISAAVRKFINPLLGFNSTMLYHEELSQLRPKIYDWYGEPEHHFHRYLKIHDAYLSHGQPIIPTQNCAGIIYFIRNPLDVAISFAHHLNFSIDQAIEIMGEKHFTFFEGSQRATPQVRQLFSSWSMHVKSWTVDCDLDILLLRYEDMSTDSLAAFSQALRYLKLFFPEDEIKKALACSQFEKLQKEEKRIGFQERSAAQPGLFFRKGIVGDWEQTLSKSQINKIIRDHAEVMQMHGYLDHQFRPVNVKNNNSPG